MNSKYEKSKSYNEPDEVMLLTDDEFESAYDTPIETSLFTLEDEINDLIYRKEELESDIKNMQFILNNELRIEERIAKLKSRYDKIITSYQR